MSFLRRIDSLRMRFFPIVFDAIDWHNLAETLQQTLIFSFNLLHPLAFPLHFLQFMYDMWLIRRFFKINCWLSSFDLKNEFMMRTFENECQIFAYHSFTLMRCCLYFCSMNGCTKIFSFFVNIPLLLESVYSQQNRIPTTLQACSIRLLYWCKQLSIATIMQQWIC